MLFEGQKIVNHTTNTFSTTVIVFYKKNRIKKR